MSDMGRWEFMRRLEELLSGISPAEREEALRYYNDYINDAGKDKEGEVIKALGTPEQVATIVKDGLLGIGGEFTEAGFQSHGAASENPLAKRDSARAGGQSDPGEQNGQSDQSAKTTPKRERSGAEIALLVILCIFASPFIIGLGGGLFGLLMGLVASLFGIVLSFGVITLTFIVVGLALVTVGMVRLFTGPLSGLLMISVGLLMTGLGLIFLVLTLLLFGKVIPALFRGIGKLWKHIFKRKTAKS